MRNTHKTTHRSWASGCETNTEIRRRECVMKYNEYQTEIYRVKKIYRDHHGSELYVFYDMEPYTDFDCRIFQKPKS